MLPPTIADGATPRITQMNYLLQHSLRTSEKAQKAKFAVIKLYAYTQPQLTDYLLLTHRVSTYSPALGTFLIPIAWSKVHQRHCVGIDRIAFAGC